MSLLDSLITPEIADRARHEAIRQMVRRFGMPRDHWARCTAALEVRQDLVRDVVYARCEHGRYVEVSLNVIREREMEIARGIARHESPLGGMAAMSDAARHVTEHPTGLSTEDLKRAALDAVEARDQVAAERAIAELMMPQADGGRS